MWIAGLLSVSYFRPALKVRPLGHGRNHFLAACRLAGNLAHWGVVIDFVPMIGLDTAPKAAAHGGNEQDGQLAYGYARTSNVPSPFMIDS